MKDDKQELGGRQVIVKLGLFPFRLLAQLDKVKRRERHTLLDRSVATDADRFRNDTCLFEFVRLRDPAMDAEHLAEEDIVEVFRRLLYAKELLQFALRLAVIGRKPFNQMLFKGGMGERVPIFDDAFIFFDAKDIFPQDLRHIGRFERICALLCENIGKRLFADARSICALRAGSQIQRIAFGNLVCATIPHLLHDRLPVVFDDHEVFFRKTEQDCLIDAEVTLRNIFAVFVGHQQHRIAFVPKRTRLKGAVVFLHVVDDIAHQPLFGADPVLAVDIGRNFELYACLGKIGLGFGVGRIPEPALFDDSADGALACCKATGRIDFLERDADDLLRAPQYVALSAVSCSFHFDILLRFYSKRDLCANTSPFDFILRPL